MNKALPVRLIASDLDGTLLDATGHLSSRTIAAIHAATSAGIVFVAATGRSHLTAAPRLAPALPAIRWAVCSNGATVFDLHEQTVVAQNLITEDHLADLADVWDRFEDIGLGWEAGDGFGADQVFQARHPYADGLADAPTERRPPSNGVVKILVSHGHLTGSELIDHVRALVPSELEVASSGAPFVEITAEGVNKAYGLAQLTNRLGIDPAESMVFGDNNNDLAMFAWAVRAVAVANATVEALAAAHEITDHHDADGVAVTIEALLRGTRP